MDFEYMSEENGDKSSFCNNNKGDININGLLLQDKYIPEEVLTELFSWVNPQQLLLCHLVCKQWNHLIKSNVWKKKAELICGQSFSNEEKVIWISYYYICLKNPFNKNLLLSPHLHKENTEKFVIINVNKDDINVPPFPDDLEFQEVLQCITCPKNTFLSTKRKLVIDLIKEGFSEQMLDHLQPTIKIHEWYCCNDWDEENANYQCSIKLLKGKLNHYNYNCHRIMRTFHFDKNLKEGHQKGHWIKFTYEFKNYGEGLRIIKFYDGGRNNVIMAGACIKLVVPKSLPINKKKKRNELEVIS